MGCDGEKGIVGGSTTRVEVTLTRRLHCICDGHIIWVPVDVDASWTDTWLARAAPYTVRLEVRVVVCIG